MRGLVGVRYLSDEVGCCDFQIYVSTDQKVLLVGRLDDYSDEPKGLRLALPWTLVLLPWPDELMVPAWYHFFLIWEQVPLQHLHRISLMVQY